jgi:hypothetical protein
MLEPAAERYFFTPRQTLKTATAQARAWGIRSASIRLEIPCNPAAVLMPNNIQEWLLAVDLTGFLKL